jgi:uncharacterized protein YcnI
MTRPSHAGVRVVVGVAIMAALWLAGLEVGGLDTGLLCLAPAFLLLLPLLAGRYPGERALTAWAAPPRRTVTARLALPRPRTRLAPRGGLLVGCSLAGRAPPRWRGCANPRAALHAVRPVPCSKEQFTMYKKIAVATAVAALAAPAAARAHVTLQPNTAAAGSFAVLDVRVPTERDNATTTKIDVQFPAGFASARYEPKPGWKVRIVKKRLATPIQTDDGPITEGVSRMVWTRTSRSGGIKPNEFVDFPISVQIPGKAGDKLTFKALQTYSNGEVVRWIGAPASDEPAPQVSVTAAQASGAPASSHGSGAAAASSHNDPAQPVSASTDGDSDGLTIAALVAGGLGLALGGAALAMSRRRTGGNDRHTPATA